MSQASGLALATVCRFLQNTNEKRNQWKMLGVLWKMPNHFSKSCGMWLDGIFFLVINLFHSINFSTFPIPFPIGNTTRFFLKQTEHLPPVWWWIACQSTIQAFGPRIKQISSHTDRPNEKNHRIFKRWLDVRNSGDVFLFLLMLKLKCDVSCSIYIICYICGFEGTKRYQQRETNSYQFCKSPHHPCKEEETPGIVRWMGKVGFESGQNFLLVSIDDYSIVLALWDIIGIVIK